MSYIYVCIENPNYLISIHFLCVTRQIATFPTVPAASSNNSISSSESVVDLLYGKAKAAAWKCMVKKAVTLCVLCEHRTYFKLLTDHVNVSGRFC